MSRMVLVAIATGLLMSACTAETVDSSSSGLSAIDPADYVGQVMYLDRTVGSMPMTAEEMGDTSNAIPVEIGLYGDYLVAWWAPGGHGRVGDRGSVVTAWLIRDSATPLSNDVRDDTPPETSTPSEDARLDVPARLDRRDTYDLPGSARPHLFVNWLEDYSREWFSFWGFHPGCV